MTERIAIGADHAGVHLKDALGGHLADRGYEVIDLGTHGTDRVDYPDFGAAVGRAVAGGDADLGLCVCGSGIGIAIAANKVPGIRAALTHDTYSAERAALSNNAQIITMGARVIGPELAKSIADAFLRETFDPNGRSAGNVAAIDAVDAKYNAR